MEEENESKKEQHPNDLRRRARLAVMNSKRVLLSSTNDDFDENEEEDSPTRKVSEEEDVTVVVDFIGDGLRGARKWLGAATVIDKETKETTFYGVPSHMSHYDVLCGKRAPVLVYPKILAFLEE